MKRFYSPVIFIPQIFPNQSKLDGADEKYKCEYLPVTRHLNGSWCLSLPQNSRLIIQFETLDW